MKFHGQANQDMILWGALFSDVPHGYFVDVGAHDGVTYSNTLVFEERGWLGVCVEAHPDYITDLHKSRKFSYIIHAAAGPQNLPDVTLYGTPFGFLSTVEHSDVSMLDAIHGYDGIGRKEYHVPMRRLDDILHDVNSPVGFELLCIDTEGYEVEVLKGFTIDYWIPRVILLEGFDTKHKDAVITWMADKGYTFADTLGVDLVYCLEMADAERLRTWREQTSLPD